MTVSTRQDGSVPSADVVREWADGLSRTAHAPLPRHTVERQLVGWLNTLVAALRRPPPPTPPLPDPPVEPISPVQAATGVGAGLVDEQLVGASGLALSIELLGTQLPRLPGLSGDPSVPARVPGVLGALAAGFADALRRRTADAQEQLTRTLLEAKQDADRARQISEARLSQVLSACPVGIAISDLDGTVLQANPRFGRLVGQPPDTLPGRPLLQVLGCADDPDLRVAYQMLTSSELPQLQRERQLAGANGDLAWTSLVATRFRDLDGAPRHLTVLEDLTEVQLLRKQLSEQTLHDQLTGLPNEHYFRSHLEEVIASAEPGATVTLCRINLDNFALISDGIGRDSGERVLCWAATRLRELVTGQRALVARVGTDEFAVLIEDGAQPVELSALAARVNLELAGPVNLGDHGLAVSAGVGVLRRPVRGVSAQELLREADATLHRVKRSGRGQWGLYDPQLDIRERERYQLAARMPGAFQNGEITLRYQPLYSLDGARVVALQALLHWARPDGTVIAHPECLSLAEETGLVLVLGRWMLVRSCADLARWSAALGADAPLLRVDLTGWLSRDPDLIGVVREALDGSGVRPEQLRIGIPLVALFCNPADVSENAEVLADLGVGVVLLGAAAGPSYFAYLEDLRVTAVEIGAEVVSRIAARPGDSVFIRAVRQSIPLVHGTGSAVIVTGVDSAQAAKWWREAGADLARGAHFGAPAPLSTLLPDLMNQTG